MTIHLVRSFTPTDITIDDKVLSARFVPYGEVADVVDVLPNGTIDRYREGFDPGAFVRQASTREPGVLARIHLRHLHDRQDGLGFLGHVNALRDEPDGLYGSVPIIASRAADVDGLIRNGVDGMSVEFHTPKGGTVERDGVRWRTKAVLWAISLEPMGAYSSARVLSYRDGPLDDEDDEADEVDTTTPPPPPDEVDEPTEAELERRAAMDLEWTAQALIRQAELDRIHRPAVQSDEDRRLEALHDDTVAAYRSH